MKILGPNECYHYMYHIGEQLVWVQTQVNPEIWGWPNTNMKKMIHHPIRYRKQLNAVYTSSIKGWRQQWTGPMLPWSTGSLHTQVINHADQLPMTHLEISSRCIHQLNDAQSILRFSWPLWKTQPILKHFETKLLVCELRPKPPTTWIHNFPKSSWTEV